MVWTMRRMLSAVGTNEGIELLLNRLSKTENNVQFLGTLTKTPRRLGPVAGALQRPCVCGIDPVC